MKGEADHCHYLQSNTSSLVQVLCDKSVSQSKVEGRDESWVRWLDEVKQPRNTLWAAERALHHRVKIVTKSAYITGGDQRRVAMYHHLPLSVPH